MNKLSGRVYVFGLRWYGWCGCGMGGAWVALSRIWKGGWCYVCVIVSLDLCVDDRYRYLYIVLGGYLRILGAPSDQSCCSSSISAFCRVLSVEDIANPDLFVYGFRSCVCIVRSRFYEGQCQPSSGSANTFVSSFMVNHKTVRVKSESNNVSIIICI